MKVVLVEKTPTRAVVRLIPGWFMRLFGAKDSIVELNWQASRNSWFATGSCRPIALLPHSGLIDNALNFVPVVTLPVASAQSEKGAV